MVLLRSYKTPFYTLLAYSLVWDALSWIAMYIVFRGSKTPIFFFIYDWIPQTGWIPTTLIFLNSYTLFVQWFLSHMLTFNRFVFCLNPVNYEKIWNKMFSSIIIFAHVYPLFCTWFFIYYGGYCQRVADYYLIDKNSTPIDQKSSFTRSSFYQLIVSAFNGLTALPMNMYILWTLLNRRKNHQKLTINQGKQPRDAEINLSIFTIILFLIAAITISCQAYYFMYGSIMSESEILLIINLQVYALDLYVCTAPWLLFLLSGGIRQQLKSMLKGESNEFMSQVRQSAVKKFKLSK
uniref:Serpentine receptor class gamma n=1 Tax=Ditylenchus dipsaci TaxID=166011 RepID=A0A915D3C9_9BILA